MEKLKFTLLVVALLLAFPVWFYAEMKQADKQVESIRNSQADTVVVARPVAKAEKVISACEDFAAMPFSKQSLVCF